MTNKNDIMQSIYDLLCEDMRSRLLQAKKDDVNLAHGEWNAIAKFLKDNGFDSIPTKENPLGKLGETAITMDLPDFNDLEETQYN